MHAERWQKIKSLFDAAQEIEPKRRKKFLENACAGDDDLRREVENLLNSFERAESFMEEPAAKEVASLFEDKKTLAANHTTGGLQNGKFIAGTILASRYRILGLLGKGGMGEVFKAEDIKLSQTVALKFLPDRLEKDRAALQRFIGEVRIARQVSHQNVCRVFDIGEIDGRHFLSMEFVDGDDLAQLLRRVGRLTSERAVEISRQLCVGLHAIHDAGILHRDFKPANVIIDSKGKARITDFGIAGLAEEVSRDEVRVGTPAYMSPEQITGKAISARSDIYALGLVLYEIFTGKPAFQADSIPELIHKHQSETPTTPSEFVKGIDPLVESVIGQCLEKNPRDRPPSALHVAMALPGGNPLQVALEAGETPSPEMVAAAPKKGSLKPAVAVACLSAVVLLFAFIVLFAGKVKHHEWIPLEKSPEALAERADSILKKLGYRAAPVDTDYGFEQNNAKYYGYPDDSPNRWERLRSGQPAVISFWHRTSPRYLEPQRYEEVLPENPPLDVAGMTRVILDTRGRLLEFQAVPPQVRNNALLTGEVDWTALFAEAGLDIRHYRQAESNWTPPVFADTFAAWEGAHVDHAEIPVRIEAAAFQGKPVYFQIVAPWDKSARQQETSGGAAGSGSAGWRAAGIILGFSLLSTIAVGVFLAVRNLRQGRADESGAFKLTIFVFLMTLASLLLTADHIRDLFGELLLLGKIIGMALLGAALTAVMYLALEPVARRRWASLIISWSRLMAGDWRDPLVGRDILIGGVLGLAHAALSYLGFLVASWAGKTPLPNPSLEIAYLQGFRHLWAMLFAISANKIFYVFGFLLLLILLVTLLKKQWLAIFAFWLLGFVILGLAFGSRDGHWAAFVVVALVSAISVVSLARFGLLATISNQIFFELSFHNAITANPSAWYFTNTIFAAAVLLGLAVYGFYTSLAGQPVFGGKILKEIE